MIPSSSKRSPLLTAYLLMAASSGLYAGSGGHFDEKALNDPERYKGKGLAGGHAVMRTFVINGVEIPATDKVMARKKYNKLKGAKK